jgi:hypothetical protein
VFSGLPALVIERSDNAGDVIAVRPRIRGGTVDTLADLYLACVNRPLLLPPFAHRWA